MIFRIVYRMNGDSRPSTREIESESREGALRAFDRYMGECGAERSKYSISQCHPVLRILKYDYDTIPA